MISVEHLTKRFDRRMILDDVSLRFDPGKLTVICGPSGGGKSTLLRCIVGLDAFDAGIVRVGDVELGASSPITGAAASEIRLRAGFVFQHFGLFAHMSVLENVIEAPIHVRGEPRRSAIERAEKLLERFGLTERRDARPRALSGGEKQRVAIARALAMSPEALLLDEPTSALDPKRKAETARMLREIAEDGTTVVVVTHEHELARSIADVAVVVRGGRIHAKGSPSDVLSPEE